MNLDQEVQRLLDEAMKQPGVAEVMEAYAVQQPAIAAHTQAQHAVAPKWVYSTSSSTSPQSK